MTINKALPLAGLFYCRLFSLNSLLFIFMKKALLAIILLVACLANAQLIKRGAGKPTYVKVEDTLGYRPFVLTKYDMITLNVADLIFTDVSVAYEHISHNGMKGYQLPLSFNAGGLPDTSDYHRRGNTNRFISSRNRIFQTGFNYNYYFNGQDRTSLYMGVGMQLGWFYYWKWNYDTLNTGWGYNLVYKNSDKKIGSHYAGIIHGGVLFNPKETVIINMRTGFGLRRYGTEYTEYTSGYFIFELSLGFKF